MADSLAERIRSFLSNKVPAFGVAPVERFNEAPPEHHPASICKDASTVIVYAVTVPKSILRDRKSVV